MCNPRKIRVRATRQLEEAWHAAVRSTVTREGAVRGEARVREPLEDLLSHAVLGGIEQVLNGRLAIDPHWQATETGWRYELDGGYVEYHRHERELEIVARCEQVVTAEGEANSERRGVVNREVVAEAERGVYTAANETNDNRIRASLNQEAEGRLEVLAQGERLSLHEEAERERQRVLDRLAAEAQHEAEQAAQRRLDELLSQCQGEANQQAARRLDEIGRRGREAFNRVLAEAYAQVLERFASQRGVKQMSRREAGDSITIEFRLPG